MDDDGELLVSRELLVQVINHELPEVELVPCNKSIANNKSCTPEAQTALSSK
jgi:hypothetical protein